MPVLLWWEGLRVKRGELQGALVYQLSCFCNLWHRSVVILQNIVHFKCAQRIYWRADIIIQY